VEQQIGEEEEVVWKGAISTTRDTEIGPSTKKRLLEERNNYGRLGKRAWREVYEGFDKGGPSPK